MRAAVVATVILAASGLVPRAALAQKDVTAEEFEAKLGYTNGAIVLKGNIATLDVPTTFRFIGADASKRLLEQAWGNPPGSASYVLGMLFPTSISPLTEEGWGVVISFDEDGHVDDKGAESIDYSKLLKQMQDATEEDNKERVKAGGKPAHLIGWAEPPSYNAQTHKMYWAKELAFGDNDHHTLNYNVRVLGRRGVLVLNAVANMDQLPAIKADMQKVLTFVEFNAGHRYADFIASTDRKAAYGIAGLVAGAVAMKAGFFKVLLAALLAAKKLILIGLAAFAAFFKKLFGGKKGELATVPASGGGGSVTPPPTQSFTPKK